MQDQIKSRRVKVLSGSVAKKIAAGEVIDRPFSVLRELLDNALDAGADRIDVSLEKGGIELIEVLDNGSGMDEEDVKLCWKSHATSKIESESDLEQIKSLGFRGEALSSISSVSRLEILSKSKDAELATELSMEGAGSAPRFRKCAAPVGTRVKVRDIFFNLPARRKFIKSAASESSLCRQSFTEKALAHPATAFTLHVDGKPRMLLTRADNHRGRVIQAYGDQLEQALLHEISGSGDGFHFRAVLGLPPLHRSDRKQIQIYCNRRRIQEYSLIHAVEYAYNAILPGGSYPVAFVFLEIDPALADFNIHPAKKEVRFKNPEQIHRRLREGISNFIDQYSRLKPKAHSIPSEFYSRTLESEYFPDAPGPHAVQHRTDSLLYHQSLNRTQSQETALLNLNENPAPASPAPASPAPASPSLSDENPDMVQDSNAYRSSAGIYGSTAPSEPMPPYRYFGQLFSLFLLVEIEADLYIIDMHAAHERILYEKFRRAKSSEQLLIPMVFETDDQDRHERFEHLAGALNRMGFTARVTEPGVLELTAVPSALRGKDRLLREIFETPQLDAPDLEHALYEKMACRTAVKDGDVLDRSTALMIIEESWRLPVKRCPHGRPIWFSLSRTELFQLLGRIT